MFDSAHRGYERKYRKYSGKWRILSCFSLYFHPRRPFLPPFPLLFLTLTSVFFLILCSVAKHASQAMLPRLVHTALPPWAVLPARRATISPSHVGFSASLVEMHSWIVECKSQSGNPQKGVMEGTHAHIPILFVLSSILHKRDKLLIALQRVTGHLWRISEENETFRVRVHNVYSALPNMPLPSSTSTRLVRRGDHRE